MDTPRIIMQDWERAKQIRREIERDWQTLKTIKGSMSDEEIMDSVMSMMLMYLIKEGVIA